MLIVFFSCYIIVGLHLSFFLYIQPLGISSTNMHHAAHRKLIRTELHPRPFQGGKNLFPHRRTWLQCHWRHRSNLENNWVFWKCWVVKSSVWNGTGYLVLSTSLWWCPNSPHVNQIFCVVGGRRGGVSIPISAYIGLCFLCQVTVLHLGKQHNEIDSAEGYTLLPDKPGGGHQA